MPSLEQKAKGKSTAWKLAALSFFMVGFGYLMVPLYSVFCDLTGFGGRTLTQSSEQQLANRKVDSDRMLSVEFDTNVNGELPWKFWVPERKIKLHPGEIGKIDFFVTNNSDVPITGRAVHSFAPAEASLYFVKTECFCFTNQELAPGETKKMPIIFTVVEGLPDRINSIVLSYTFFKSLVVETAVSQITKDAETNF